MTPSAKDVKASSEVHDLAMDIFKSRLAKTENVHSYSADECKSAKNVAESCFKIAQAFYSVSEKYK
jgi:hypothetical protein